MSFFAILLALLLEQARPLSRSNPVHAGLRAWTVSVRRNFDAGQAHHGWVAWALAAIVPAALPDILVGLRIAMGFAWTTLVAAEMVAATQGLGQMVLNASNFLRTDVVVMGILVIGGIALALDAALRWLEQRLLPWHGR